MDKDRRQGFTLVELSIVLVILGLLVGGVLTGQSLIRASELRSIGVQHERFLTAVHTFRDKYFALPGDMANAQSIWGVAHATPATCATTASTTALTCNGDGDGLISPAAAGSNESFRLWQHLANAGLIEGTYSGITQGASITSATQANSPAGKIGSALWYISNFGTASNGTVMFDGFYGNGFQYGGMQANSTPLVGILRPEEQWNLDTKLDDGKPATGKLVVRTQSGVTLCTNAASDAVLTGDYLLTGTTLTCAPLFRRQF